MDLKQYFTDMHATEAMLERKHPDGIVYVTSLFYRERNSTPGAMASATCRNAARVITDGTHRESSPEEVDMFFSRQKQELERNMRAEQLKKKQYFVVVNQNEQSDEAVMAGASSAVHSPSRSSPLVDSE